MREVELVSAKSWQGMQHSHLGGRGQQAASGARRKVPWSNVIAGQTLEGQHLT